MGLQRDQDGRELRRDFRPQYRRRLVAQAGPRAQWPVDQGRPHLPDADPLGEGAGAVVGHDQRDGLRRRQAGASGSLARPRGPWHRLSGRVCRRGRRLYRVSRPQYDGEYRPAEYCDRVRLPPPRGGVRNRRDADPVFARRHLFPRLPGRAHQHALRRRAGGRAGDAPRHRDGAGAALEQLARAQAGAGLCRDLPQHSAGAAALFLVGAAQQDGAGSARRDPDPARRLCQQPRHRLSGCRGEPGLSLGRGGLSRRHRPRHRRLALGPAAPGGDRPAAPGGMDRARAYTRSAGDRLSRRWRAAPARCAGAQGLQFQRRAHRLAGIRRAADRAYGLFRHVHRRDRARRHPRGELGTERGGDGARLAVGPADAARRPAAGAQGHRAANHQPISRDHQEQLARRADRLSGPGFDRQHLDEPDRPGGRGDRDHHGGLPVHQPRDLSRDEPLQPRRRAGGTMTDLTDEMRVPAQRPPTASTGTIGWLRANLFNSVLNSILTLLCLVLFAAAIPPVIRWAFVNAIWTAPNGQACRGGGACWAFIGEKIRFILFGFFPSGELWRPIAVVAVFLLMILVACDRRSWGRWLAYLWAAGLAAVLFVMHGGSLGLSTVETRLWSGLPLTLILAVIAMVAGFPLGVLLALGRRSNLPAVRATCVGYIEL